jgi:hypothetical protein
MSTISSIYDALETLVSTELTDYTRLSDSYFLEENPEIELTKGYGIVIGALQNTNRLLSCDLTSQISCSKLETTMLP